MIQPDFLIIGGGIIGLAIAKELKSRYPDNHVTILEKEKQVGLHSSGRNSGVLHSGTLLKYKFVYSVSSYGI